MGKALSDDQIEYWEENGCVFPIRAFSAAEAEANFDRYLALEREIGEEPQNRFKIKAHLPFPWMWDIIQSETILDAVEDLIGPNILCWGSSFFTKQANDPRFVSWHQDSTYYGLSERATVNVWYAFSPSKIESGCMRFIPGTHRMGQLDHQETFAENNLLVKGQTIKDIDESSAVDVELEAGEFSIHHESVVHGSNPNSASWARVGLSIHYITPEIHQLQLQESAATLVRGEDRFGHWRKDPKPERDFDPACLAALDASYREYKSGAGKLG